MPTDSEPDLDSWFDRISRSGRPATALSLVTPLGPSDGGSGAFLGLASDSLRYWIKPANNPQGRKTLAAETIVASLGSAMGAPVRPISLISIPDGLAEWRYKDHYALTHEIAHASLDLGGAIVAEEWSYTSSDHNADRQAFIYALWDLCLGGDPQWLHDIEDDYSIWSFDHGFWFGGDGEWDARSLLSIGERPWQYDLDLESMSSSALERAARAVRAISDVDILSAVSGVPVDWGVSNGDLAALALVVSTRRAGVASRAEALAASALYP